MLMWTGGRFLSRYWRNESRRNVEQTDEFIIHDILERVCTFSYTQSYVSLAYDSVVRIVHAAQFPRFSGLSLPLKWRGKLESRYSIWGYDSKVLTQKHFFPTILSLHWNVQWLSLQPELKKLSQTLVPGDFGIESVRQFLGNSVQPAWERRSLRDVLSIVLTE